MLLFVFKIKIRSYNQDIDISPVYFQ